MRKVLNLIISLLPLSYFLIIVNSLKTTVPIHYNILGEPDAYGSKYSYLIICFLPLVIWILSNILNKYIKEENSKIFTKFMSVLIIILSLLCLLLLHQLKHNNLNLLSMIIILIGGLFIYLGNTLNKIQPNRYFGIRLPATLKSSKVWKQIHYLGRYLFLSFGLSLIILSLLKITPKYILSYMIILLILILIGLFIYSEKLLKKEKSKIK
ncbi:MAG: SdpI family protein [Mycoplasmatales bacterium]